MNRASGCPSTSRIRIVFVCTGNRFRSPLAAAYARRLLAGSNVGISSCGTATVAGRALGALPEAIEVGASSAIDLSGHRTRWVGDAALADADLVIGFERSHVASAVLEGGASRAKTFVLGELVRILRELEVTHPQRVRDLVALADATRDAAAPGLPELRDPFGRSRGVYERTAVEVWKLTFELIALLFPKPLPAAGLPRPRLSRMAGLSRRR
jgi:protein-tyrosine phosphatase